MEHTDDKLLVERAQNGDSGAFNLLMKRWQGRIYRVAYRYFADSDDAKEITQKTFITIYRKLDTLAEPGKFSSWIYRVANNLCLDELKRAGRRKSQPLEHVAETSNGNGTPEKDLESQELGEILQKALMLLPDEQRVVVILKEFEGLKFREIAEILDESENTIKSRMYYGLRSLREILKKWNIQHEYLNYD